MTSAYVPNTDTQTKWADVSGSAHTGSSNYLFSGKALTSPTITIDTANDYAYFDAENVTWTSVTLSASGAVLYVSGAQGAETHPLVGYIDFGSTLSSSNGDFTITWSGSGILRIANG
jgi:hypothetical protein